MMMKVMMKVMMTDGDNSSDGCVFQRSFVSVVLDSKLICQYTKEIT